MKLKKNYILFLIITILFSISFADVRYYDSKEIIKYEETWDEPTVVSEEIYPNIQIIETAYPDDDGYYYYDLNGENKGESYYKSRIVRIKKSVLSYKYDYIYDIDDGKHIINNPLNKDMKNEEFFISDIYSNFYPPKTIDVPYGGSVDFNELNGYYYFDKREWIDGNCVYTTYKVYKDLIKINSVKYDRNILLNLDNNWYNYNSSIPKYLIAGKTYYKNLKTNEIIEIGEDTIVIGFEYKVYAFVFVVFLVLLIFVLLLSRKSKQKVDYERKKARSVITDAIDDLEYKDPNFNKEEFLQWVESIFIELQTAWTNKDYKRVKVFETNDLYDNHKARIERDIRNKITNRIEGIAIKDKYINHYYEEEGFEVLRLTIVANMINYIIDDNTLAVLQGSNRKAVTKWFSIDFKREKGITDRVGMLESVNCPNCGAAVDISVSEKCEYCNSILNTSNYNWKMCEYKEVNV